MSVDGAWTVTVSTPRGDQVSTLTIQSDGAAFTATMAGQRGTSEIKDGKINGANLSWTNQITSPMPMTLSYKAVVEGDGMTGSVQLGSFGSAPLKGVRA
ncbi:MAG: hypothetical protein U1E50_08935 [Caulobacteraceae bacterium]